MPTFHHVLKSATAGLATFALMIGLAACGDDEPAGNASAKQTASNGDVFNGVDVRFATDMIPHHAQAIEMVTLTAGRPIAPDVLEIADAIRATQALEVETMVDWLTAWGEPVPATSLDHSNAGHDMGKAHDAMPGMMSEAEMAELASAPDDEFQDLWLEMMIEHHQGAIEMSRAEQSDGEFALTITLAKSIEAAQREEIDRMQLLLDS